MLDLFRSRRDNDPGRGQALRADKFIWASDFPHFDASPAAVEETRQAVSSLPDEAQRLILGDNVAKIYNL